MSDQQEDPGSRQNPTRTAIVAVLVGIGVVVALLVAYQILDVLKIVVLAALLALVLRTVAKGLEKLGVPPLFVALILLAGVGAVGAALYFIVLPDVAREVRGLASANGAGTLGAVGQSLGGIPFAPNLNELLRQVENRPSEIVSAVPRILSAAGAITGLLAAVFLALYFAASPHTYVRGVLRLIPEGRRDDAERFIRVLSERLRGWIVGTAIVSLLLGATAGLGLWLLGVPFPLTLGILAGILNIIPLFGSILGAVIPVLLALTVSPATALGVVALFVVINQIDGNVLQPQIIGRQVHVPPALILVSILALGTLLGPIVGTLLAIPAAVFVVTLLDQFSPKEHSPEDKEESEEGDRHPAPEASRR